MLYCQILLPLATVQVAIDDVALTPYRRTGSAFHFEGWQDQQQ